MRQACVLHAYQTPTLLDYSYANNCIFYLDSTKDAVRFFAGSCHAPCLRRQADLARNASVLLGLERYWRPMLDICPIAQGLS